ncbi:MAG: YdeI/OmpD-associated family protein [Sphingobacteriales bacterium]
MLKKGEHIERVPAEIAGPLKTDGEAPEILDALSKGYKQGYCDWVGSAKQAETRQVRAEKALKMLQNKQKTLKT